jgi:hypothetical protein
VLLGLTLSSGTLAAAREAVITGTVEGFDKDGSMYLNIGTRRPKAFMAPIFFPGLKPPKEGEKVRVHYYPIYSSNGAVYKVIATKIEKVGDADVGSKKK